MAPVIFNLFLVADSHWPAVMVFPPMLTFHVPTVWMAASSTCADWKPKPRPQMTGSMNFSMQTTLPFLLILLKISRAAWTFCLLLKACWSSCEYEEDWSPAVCCQLRSVHTLLLSPRWSPVQGRGHNSTKNPIWKGLHRWIIFLKVTQGHENCRCSIDHFITF